MPVFAEGRVEHQKLNQTIDVLLFGWVFGVQLDYSCLFKSVTVTAEKRVNMMSSYVFGEWEGEMKTDINFCEQQRKKKKVKNIEEQKSYVIK